MTEPAKKEEMKAVTSEEVLARVASLGGKIIRTALWAGLLFSALIPAGLLLGGIAGATVASHFALGAWAATGATVLGVGLGGAGGFFGAALAVRGMVEDLAVKGGLQAGEMGLRSLLRLLKQARQQKPAHAAKVEILEGGVEATHKAVKWFLGDAFKDAVKPKEEPAAAPENTAKPPPLPAMKPGA